MVQVRSTRGLSPGHTSVPRDLAYGNLLPNRLPISYLRWFPSLANHLTVRRLPRYPLRQLLVRRLSESAASDLSGQYRLYPQHHGVSTRYS